MLCFHLQAALVNSQMEEYSAPVITSAAESTREAVSKVRKAAIAAKAARAVAGMVRNMRK